MEILRGFMFGLGFCLSFILVCIIIAVVIIKLFKMLSSDDDIDDYEVKDLLEPFRIYQKHIVYNEMYEEMAVVSNIITALESGNIIDDVKLYKIDSNTSLEIVENDDKSSVNLVTKYKILGKKNI